jgi:hypothetical protein
MDAKINKNVAPKIRKLALQVGMCLERRFSNPQNDDFP